ncbi:MAG TPA: ribosome small subunit-dependent GTPase A [Candidatus Corynebacterium avicola]|uniref:Ribosome small subunit-dependent GTPase A n=1 Tax=Candidatus Corynebacterium avicola TaxID=2838527 RepID=A0A9D1RNJ8_9CORY|nr:ribosome small subunit-dependent GTPase A [Candidatus Corynebacterium avicola]
MARSSGRRHYDESDIRVRPGKGSRPRTKDRPDHRDAETGMVVTKDRGRWGVVIDGASPDAPPAICMRARELGRTPVVVGDRVAVVGDTSGRDGTLARIVRLEDRTTVLRRTADDTDPYERVVVANADQLLIVTAVADPPPRSGFVERALIAAFVGGLRPVLCLTKSDLADPTAFAAEFEALDIEVIVCGVEDPLDPVSAVVDGNVTALIGHSGVGKSTLVNRLVPGARRETGEVSGVGKGRHTSTQSVALRLPQNNGWIVDTPGIRSFGLAHIKPDQVIEVFEDLRDVIEDCPRGCTHAGPPADPECALDDLTGASARRVAAVRTLLEALRSNNEWEL